MWGAQRRQHAELKVLSRHRCGAQVQAGRQPLCCGCGARRDTPLRGLCAIHMGHIVEPQTESFAMERDAPLALNAMSTVPVDSMSRRYPHMPHQRGEGRPRKGVSHYCVHRCHRGSLPPNGACGIPRWCVCVDGQHSADCVLLPQAPYRLGWDRGTGHCAWTVPNSTTSLHDKSKVRWR